MSQVLTKAIQDSKLQPIKTPVYEVPKITVPDEERGLVEAIQKGAETAAEAVVSRSATTKPLGEFPPPLVSSTVDTNSQTKASATVLTPEEQATLEEMSNSNVKTVDYAIGSDDEGEPTDLWNKTLNVPINIAAGVVSGSNELVSTAKYAFAKTEAGKLDALKQRNETNRVLNRWRGAGEAGVVSNFAYGASKMLAVPVGAAGAVGKVTSRLATSARPATAAISKAASTGATAATAGVIVGSETKYDAMNRGVDESTASTAGLYAGTGMAAAVALPVTLPFRITSAGKLAANVAAAATLSTVATSGSQYAAGNLIKGVSAAKAYQEAGDNLINIATDPASIAIGIGLGGVLGAYIGTGRLKSYKQNVALLKTLNTPNSATLIPDDVISALKASDKTPEQSITIQKWVDDNDVRATDILGIKQDLDLQDITNNVRIEAARAEQAGKPWTDIEFDLQLKRAINAERVQAVVNDLNYSKIDDTVEGLSDSDKLLIHENDMLISEYYKTGDVSLLNRLEIPQVHRDVYMMRQDGFFTEADIKSSYFNTPIIVQNFENGIPYSPKAPTITTRALKDNQATSTSLPNPMQPTKTTTVTTASTSSLTNTIAKGEGNYDSLNRGVAGDSPNARLPQGITLAEVMRQQALPRGHPERLFAVGRYQVIPDTMRAAVKALKLDINQPFTPALQDKIMTDFLIKNRKNTYNYITSSKEPDANSLYAAILDMAKEFASVSNPTNQMNRITAIAASIKRGALDSIRGDKGLSYYQAGKGGNKASISIDQVAKDLHIARERYQLAIKEGKSPNEAWAVAFKTDAEYSLRVSSTVEADKASTYVSNSRQIYSDTEARQLDAEGNLLNLPSKQSLVTRFLDSFRVRDNVYDSEVAYLRNEYGDSVTEQLINSRAIQKVYEEQSYQYALSIREEAIRQGFKGQELNTITNNAFAQSQTTFKGGKSKIYAEELEGAKIKYRDELASGEMKIDDLKLMATIKTTQRIDAASKLEITRPITSGSASSFNKERDIDVDESLAGKSITINGKSVAILEDDYIPTMPKTESPKTDVTIDLAGKVDDDLIKSVEAVAKAAEDAKVAKPVDDTNATVKTTVDKEGNTITTKTDKSGNILSTTRTDANGNIITRYKGTDGNWYTRVVDKEGKLISTKPETVTSTLKLEDGTTITRITSRLEDGTTITRLIDEAGNRLGGVTPDYLKTLVSNQLSDNAIVRLDGKEITRAQLIQEINNNQNIGSKAVEKIDFNLCAI